ncbi:MAG: flagellar export chaperone FliS [Bacillota bacterium]
MGNPYAQYREMQVQTAGPEQLVLMLYDGALRFCNGARVAMEKKDYETAHNQIARAQDIIYELMAGLNPQAGDIADHLFSLYEYFTFRLIQANLRRDPQPIGEVMSLVAELRSAWAQAMASLRPAAHPVTAQMAQAML